MRFGNCWTYALSMWFRFGGSLIVQKSIWSWVPHARHAMPDETDGLAISEFVPLKPKRDWFNRTFPFYSLWFHGRIRTGRLKGKTTQEEISEDA